MPQLKFAFLTFAFVLPASVASQPASAASQASFELLPSPNSTTGTSAEAISGDGQVVIGRFGSTQFNRACRWVRSGGPASAWVFEDLGIPNYSLATAVNFDGSAIVGVHGLSVVTTVQKEAFLWTESAGFLGLGTTPGGFPSSGAYDISDDGSVVIGTTFDHSDFFNTGEPFVWTTATGIAGIGSIPGATKSLGTLVSGDGEYVFGWHSMPGFATIPFRWSINAGMESPFGTDPMGRYGPTATNHSGSIVGLSGAVIISPNGIRWSEVGGAEALVGPDTTPLGGSNQRLQELEGMDASGRVMVGQARGSTGFAHIPFRWTASDGKRNLYWELVGAGVNNLTGIQLETAAAVSSDGRLIVGRCIPPSGPIQAYVAQLDYPKLGTNFCSPVAANSTGLPGHIEAQKSFVASENDISLAFTNLPAGQFGLLLNGTETAVVPLTNGTLCLGGAIGRYNTQVFNVNPGGTAEVQIDLSSTPTPFGSAVVQAGETWHFQGWYRDTGFALPSNFTDGVSVVFY